MLTIGSKIGNLKLFDDFAGTFCSSTAVRTGLHNASVSLSRNITSLRTHSNIPKHMSALLAMLSLYEVTDVTSVNTVVQQRTGIVRLNIQFEIT
jgi:hypothetical protein